MERERKCGADSGRPERTRIVAEVHDIVSRNVSLNGGAGRGRLLGADHDAGEAAASMRAVEAAGRDAMTALRHLLGMLAPGLNGEEHNQADSAPQPSPKYRSSLIDRVSFAGLPVEVYVSGKPRPLSAGVNATVYRVRQPSSYRSTSDPGFARRRRPSVCRTWMAWKPHVAPWRW
ncbi:histidine kinase [Streptomyces sp. NPDC005393]|uniref:histidine kinase n=1 Tax=Streptomyces sp. NPDC005393 TaxID=3157041 RepID=UPI0033A7DB1E